MKVPTLLIEPTILLEALLAPDGDSGRLLRRCLESGGTLELCSTEAALLVLRRAAGERELLRSAGLTSAEVERWITALELRLTLLEASVEQLAQVASIVGSTWQALSDVDRQSLTVAACDRCLLVTREPRLRELIDSLARSELGS